MTDTSRVNNPTVAFVGLGNMGIPMASRLLTRGLTVTGYDTSETPRANIVALGGIAAQSPGECGSADILILMLPNSDIVESVLLRDGLLAEMRSGSIIIDMGSSEPLRTQSMSAEAEAAGVRYIDAPVSGGVPRAKTGTLTIMAGGDRATVEELGPILSLLGTVTYTGASGSGHALKALNNLISGVHLAAASEAMLTGIAFGLDPQVMLSVINTSSGKSGSTENKWPNFILPETYDSGFGAALLLKDMRIAAGLAERMGAGSRVSDAAVELWADAVTDLPRGADHTEIARWIRDGARAEEAK